MRYKQYLILLALTYVCQLSADIIDSVEYRVETTATFSTGTHTPFWFVSNRQGLTSVNKDNGYVRGEATVTMDSIGKWGFRAGIDFAVPWNFSSRFVMQQLYGEARFWNVALTVGSKERTGWVCDPRLSSGDLLYSGNARPVPEVKISIPDFIDIPGLNHWLGVRGYLSYGMFTDWRWQWSFNTARYKNTSKVWYNTKGILFRIGNLQKFPLQFEGGLEMGTQFGGNIYRQGRLEKMPVGFKDIIRATIGLGGGSNTPKGEQTNVYGNQTGEWVFGMKWHGEGWSVKVYYEHFFEDHSMMFFDYAWKDMLLGIEAEFPQNRFVSKFVYEYLNTRDQSGPVYWDKDDKIPEQVSGRDNYYNHSIYTGWQHWGMGLGNPLIISPIYNTNGMIYFPCNRIRGHHFAIAGNPTSGLSYRILASYTRGWGTYSHPFDDIKRQLSVLLEASYNFKFWKGFSTTLGVAADRGGIPGRNYGVMISLTKTGNILD